MNRLFLLVVLGTLFLSACSPAAAAEPAAQPTQAATATLAPTATATELPSPTATLAPTSTPEPTATAVPPTATPIPPLAVLEDGFQAWCAPVEYEGVLPTGYAAPDYARKFNNSGEMPVVPIPAAYCVVSYQFNQAAPQGLELRVIEGSSIFVKKPLAPADGQPDVAWAMLDHAYIINPPLWEVNYTLAVVGPGEQELWARLVKFSKPIPEECPYGGLPDPITLYCAVTDPWEVEPHPDAVYPYDRSKLTPAP